MPGPASLLLPSLSRSPRNLAITRCPSCDADPVRTGDFIVTNAIASAAHNRVPAMVKRTAVSKRFRLNEYGVLMCYLYFAERLDCQRTRETIKTFNVTFL